MSAGDVVSQFLVDRISARGLELRNVRRSLFGAVNHSESKKFVKDELEKQNQTDREKWNFDFTSEQPLNCSSKRYEWTSIPSPSEKSEDGKGPNDSDEGKVARVNGEFQNNSDNSHLKGKEKQLRVTDFMRKRKHSTNLKEDSPEAGVCGASVAKSVRRSST